jgi:hypothetical protein
MSDLLESLEEDEKELLKLNKAEAKEEPAKEPEEAPKEEPKPEEPAKEPAKEPEEDNEPKTPSDWARHRRELRETQTAKKALEDKIAELSRPAPAAPVKEPEKVAPAANESLTDWRARNPEPDKEKDLAGWLVWNAEDNRKWRDDQIATQSKSDEDRRLDNLVNSANQEILETEEAYKKTNPDYDNAMNYAKSEFTKALKITNPGMSEGQIKQAIKNHVLKTALQCNRDGTNLGDVLYDQAIERFGYEPKEGETAVSLPAKAAAQKPNLRMISSNKKKSASPLGGGGEGAKPRISIEQASEMSPAELMGLEADDWEYLNSKGFN